MFLENYVNVRRYLFLVFCLTLINTVFVILLFKLGGDLFWNRNTLTNLTSMYKLLKYLKLKKKIISSITEYKKYFFILKIKKLFGFNIFEVKLTEHKFAVFINNFRYV